MSLSSHCTHRMQSPDVAFFKLLYIYMGFTIEEKLRGKSERLKIQWVGLLEYRDSTNWRWTVLRITNYFLLIFPDANFAPWVVTNQPEINLIIKSFEPASVWWTGPTEGSKYQQKAFIIKRIKWNLQLLHFSPKRGATINLCNRLEENVFTFPWNKCPLTPEKTIISRYRNVPSAPGFFLLRTRHKERLTATIDFVLKPKNEYRTLIGGSLTNRKPKSRIKQNISNVGVLLSFLGEDN
jgi:hypothetical protein